MTCHRIWKLPSVVLLLEQQHLVVDDVASNAGVVADGDFEVYHSYLMLLPNSRSASPQNRICLLYQWDLLAYDTQISVKIQPMRNSLQYKW